MVAGWRDLARREWRGFLVDWRGGAIVQVLAIDTTATPPELADGFAVAHSAGWRLMSNCPCASAERSTSNGRSGTHPRNIAAITIRQISVIPQGTRKSGRQRKLPCGVLSLSITIPVNCVPSGQAAGLAHSPAGFGARSGGHAPGPVLSSGEGKFRFSSGLQGFQDFGHAGCSVIIQLITFQQDTLTFQFM
jgi:hypothetical protein